MDVFLQVRFLALRSATRSLDAADTLRIALIASTSHFEAITTF